MASEILKLESQRKAPHMMTYEIVLAKLRYMQIALFGAGTIILALVIAIIMMLPLKQIEVRYVEFANDAHVTPKVYSSNLDTTSKVLLVRSFLRNYVVDRHTVDKVSEVPRFKRVRAMSTDRIFDVHKKIYGEVEKGLSGGTRDIFITYDQPLGNGVHEIEFETIDERGGEVSRKEWVVKIKYHIPSSYEVSKEAELLNPLGLIISGYHFTQKEKQGA